MIRSMTGYGAASGICGDDAFKIEIKSLNSRYFDFNVKMPSFLFPYENQIKSKVNLEVKRGKISLFIKSTAFDSFAAKKKFNPVVIAAYLKELRILAKEQGLNDDISVSDIINLPGIFCGNDFELSEVKFKKYYMPVLKRALYRFNSMREKEGANIVKDFMKRLKKIEKIVNRISRLAIREPFNIQDRLDKRLKKTANSLRLSDERLAQEVVFLVDKADITEEIVRIRSHCELFNAILVRKNEAGKHLEFIAQEMNREANTIASKTQNKNIIKYAIDIKLENEKIKEQVQNIE